MNHISVHHLDGIHVWISCVLHSLPVHKDQIASMELRYLFQHFLYPLLENLGLWFMSFEELAAVYKFCFIVLYRSQLPAVYSIFTTVAMIPLKRLHECHSKQFMLQHVLPLARYTAFILVTSWLLHGLDTRAMSETCCQRLFLYHILPNGTFS